MGFISTSTNFHLGLVSIGLISLKNIAALFAQPHGTNIHIYIYIGFISLGLREPNTFWPGFTFPGPNSYKLYWARFAEPHVLNIYRIRFPWPSGPKHILTWVYFPSAWFIFNLLGLVLLSFTEPTYIYIYIYICMYVYTYIYERTVLGWNIATYFVISSICIYIYVCRIRFRWPSGLK